MNKLVLGAVGAAVVVVGYFGATSLGLLSGAPPDEAEISEFLQSTKDSVLAEKNYFGDVTGTVHIDDWTNIGNPTIDGSTIRFNMVSLLDAAYIKDRENWEESYMASRIYAARKHICEMDGINRMLDAGVVFQYAVLSNDGETLGEVTAQKGFCDAQ